MELWYTEYQTPSLGITLKIDKTLFRAKSAYQDIAVIETLQFGKMLVLDGTVQTTGKDEFIYHEMISHVPLSIHGNPASVLVIGGGDGGVVREVLKHDSVERVVLAEIDEMVIDVARRYFPEISVGLDDKRVEVKITDGIEYVKNNRDAFDVIIIDSTDPVGPATGLFAEEFYASVFECLTGNGVFTAQTESPFLHKDLINKAYTQAKRVFPEAYLYTCPIPTYPGGYWSFTLGAKRKDAVLNPAREDPDIPGTKYWSPDIQKAAFVLPKFVREIIGG